MVEYMYNFWNHKCIYINLTIKVVGARFFTDVGSSNKQEIYSNPFGNEAEVEISVEVGH